jgi:uncharacterized membrane protein
VEKPRAPFWSLPWRYGLFLLVCVSMVPLGQWLGWQMGVMAGFDLAVLVFAATLVPFFAHDTADIRRHARNADGNRTTMLVMTAVVMAVILVVIASALRQKEVPSPALFGLIILTLMLAWCFSNLVYTLHYAYLFYRGGARAGKGGSDDHGGLSFPERSEPDYWDFAYFGFTLGMTFQTSDVAITSPAIRRVALFHSLAAFVFNLGIIAFTINIIGG